MAYEYVFVEKRDSCAVVTLNRHCANPINIRFIDKLVSVIAELEKDSDVRCIVLTGSAACDRFFFADADVREISGGEGVSADKSGVALRSHLSF